ncbi:soluble lytic murein transglycosylase [Altererythrobacter atlanticus]|uniref:Soluble lytic murein transglycosylase n=1 Tax=Croceibacterium atlanticum TaxID=1267766 RepID=A0A0F7KKX5_9SPHN|nr:lytic transglycosylase domain-containing protein [Croceibacterium atlanticum]AKH41218.1 Soluble lytic murein transglycosylase precursor [Croceibacterium atlanticum]MBB5732736.1 soluble lytic murein transglycosylase [Croceibacterium atlanticum]
MSHMLRTSMIAALLASACATSAPALANQGNEWDQARASLVAREPGRMVQAISRWAELSGNSKLSFTDYADFLLRYDDFPDQTRLRAYAENRLREEFVDNGALIAFFDKFPPVTNYARAHYALALMGSRPGEARAIAREAWRGGEMSDTAASSILAMYGQDFTQDDQDARMDALLWQRDREAAERQLPRTSGNRRAVFAARLAILQGGDGAVSAPEALSDPGYLYNRSRELRLEGRPQQAVAMLAERPLLTSIPFDQAAWVEELLNVARLGTARQAQRIAASVDDGFRSDADISDKGYSLRDDYTSLMWLGGTRALWELGDAANASPLFYRYGAAARTPQTRSKGFFWAGHAAKRAGDTDSAARYFEMAADYPDRFYGQLALAELGRSLPAFAEGPAYAPTEEERRAFMNAPLTAAVTEVARDAPWSQGIRFYRAIADRAETPGEHMLVAELARQIGRRDLAVNLFDSAEEDGVRGFTRIGFPTLVPPQGTDWTMVHAIARQESQFAENAISHAGARGLMQLMPATAREEAGKAGLTYMSASLIADPGYNVRLGSNHFERLYARYGSYPLAVAAYNAGPGNVNKWLRQNGDPRTGSIAWIDWIEQIPFFETKNYVQRVLENAVMYETLYPDKATKGRSRTLGEFLR